MIYTLGKQAFEIVDEPLQEHVEAWERAARALRSEDAKPYLRATMEQLKTINVTAQSLPALLVIFAEAAKNITAAVEVLEANETLTMSSNRGMMVKAAITAGWIKAPVMVAEDVDKMKPGLVAWLAEKVGAIYLEAVEIPKN